MYKTRRLIVALLICIGFLSIAPSAIAHHPMDGMLPSNFFEGFISGLAHPIIGLDHFAFIVAIGLLAVGQARGAIIPGGFVLAAMAGTGIHLLKFDLPAVEILIASSVIAFGVMLAMPNKPNWIVLTLLGAIAGLFHGYAYGESIVGAEMTPIVAYLLGFTLIQYGVSLLALKIGNAVSKNFAQKSLSPLRMAGFAIGAIGAVFLTNSLVG